MPDFNTFIRNNPELQDMSRAEQKLEYQSYIEMVLESFDDYRDY